MKKPQKDIDLKIVSIFGRFFQIIRTLYWNVAKREGLSPIQIQFILFLASHSQTGGTVSRLSSEFGLTQATVSDAITSLIEKKFVIKKHSKKDGRVFYLSLTPSGVKLSKTLSHWADGLREGLKDQNAEDKEKALEVLMEVVKAMQAQGVIERARICLSCGNFIRDAFPRTAKPHECGLTHTPLAVRDLNVDCSTYKPMEIT